MTENDTKQNNGQIEKQKAEAEIIDITPVDKNISTEDLRTFIRKVTIGASSIFRSRIIQYNGTDIEIKEPSVEGWGEILVHARTKKDGEESLNFAEYLVWSVIYCSYVPGSNIRIFDVEDYDVLVKKPKSGFVGEFSDIAGDLMKVDTEEATKNLEAIAGGN